MKILVFGNGFIASHLNYKIIKDRILPNTQYIKELLSYHKPNIIINCIGYTGGHNIDGCEINKERTLESNLTIPTILATECNKLGIKMIHIGSGCIFYGESPNLKVSLQGPEDTGWKESDNPKLEKASFYSKIKYAADLSIGNLPNTCILRIRMPISTKNSPRNLINKMLKYSSVLEAPNSVTFIDDLVKVIDWVIDNNKTGIYHVTNPTPMTHVQLLEEYRKYKPEHKYNIINEQELGQFILAPRSNCFLNTDKLTSEGFIMTPTLEALTSCMFQYIQGN